MVETTPNPWKETVRDVFDILVLSPSALTEVERRILDWIKLRHHDYFCGGKTLAEWEKEFPHG